MTAYELWERLELAQTLKEETLILSEVLEYQNRFRAFLEGLEMQNIDSMLLLPPEGLRKIGEGVASVIKDLRTGKGAIKRTKKITTI